MVDELETLRSEIDRIDGEIIDKVAEWVRASKELESIDESFIHQLQRPAYEHGVDVEGVDRVLRALSLLVEQRRGA